MGGEEGEGKNQRPVPLVPGRNSKIKQKTTNLNQNPWQEGEFSQGSFAAIPRVATGWVWKQGWNCRVRMDLNASLTVLLCTLIKMYSPEWSFRSVSSCLGRRAKKMPLIITVDVQSVENGCYFHETSAVRAETGAHSGLWAKLRWFYDNMTAASARCRPVGD